MQYIRLTLLSLLIVVLSASVGFLSSAHAEKKDFRDTDLPLPRFVSLSVDKANMRTGPGRKYPIKWVFKRKYMPVEIIQEFEHWRKIKDIDGEQGWVHKSLLSGRRTAVIMAKGLTKDKYGVLRAKEDVDAKIIAKLENGVIVDISRCNDTSCKVSVGGYNGWIERKFIYGIYEDEELN